MGKGYSKYLGVMYVYVVKGPWGSSFLLLLWAYPPCLHTHMHTLHPQPWRTTCSSPNPTPLHVHAAPSTRSASLPNLCQSTSCSLSFWTQFSCNFLFLRTPSTPSTPVQLTLSSSMLLLPNTQMPKVAAPMSLYCPCLWTCVSSATNI